MYLFQTDTFHLEDGGHNAEGQVGEEEVEVEVCDAPHTVVTLLVQYSCVEFKTIVHNERPYS
jgi:hypothetical protein